MVLAHRLWQGAEEFTSVKILAQCLAQGEGLRAPAGITLLPDQVFLSPTADTPPTAFTSLGSFRRTFGLRPRHHPELFSTETPLGFLWLLTFPPRICASLSHACKEWFSPFLCFTIKMGFLADLLGPLGVTSLLILLCP